MSSRAASSLEHILNVGPYCREKLPGRFFELNIHFGVYLGGMGDFTDLFLGHTDWLRGCIADVKYNGNNLLQKARQRTSSQVSVTHDNHVLGKKKKKNSCRV